MAQVDRFSVTMPPELGEGVRQAAARQGTSVSTWLTEAAADKLRNELLGAALDQWEAEDGCSPRRSWMKRRLGSGLRHVRMWREGDPGRRCPGSG